MENTNIRNDLDNIITQFIHFLEQTNPIDIERKTDLFEKWLIEKKIKEKNKKIEIS